MTSGYEANHPFTEWASTPAYERGKLARAALRLHRTTNGLLHAYFTHNLQMDGQDVKTAGEVCRDLMGVVSPWQVRREARAFDPDMAKRMAGADDR